MRFIELYEDSYKRPESDKHFDRNQLPQIRRSHVKDSPFNYKEGTLSLDKIKPVQSQRVQGLSKKAQDVFKNKEDRPFIIDKNNYLINGHHRYDAAHILGITKVKVLKIDADIEDVMKHFSHTASDTEVMKDSLKKSLAKKIKQRLDAEAGGGGGAGGSGAGASAGGDGGSTGSSGDGGSADSGDTGSSDSAPTSDAPVARGFVGIGTYMPGAKRKKKKKKNYGYGKGIYETIEAAQDLNALMKGIEADLKQREKDLKKLPQKSIYKEEDDDDIVEYYDEIHPVVIKAWKSVYPNVPLKAIDDEDLYMQYTTADEYEHHGGNGKDFYLSLGVQYIGDDEPPKGYVNVGDAYAGNYKGVVAKIIASLFEWLEQKHPNMGVRELGIHMNRNVLAWTAIAKKVGAQIEKRGYYENFADSKVKGKSIYESLTMPKFDAEWGEAERYPEFRKIGKEAWIKLAKTGKAVTITDASDIENTDAGEPESFYNLDNDKQKRALQQIARGNVELPIVAVYSDGYKELIGGNTRLTAMMLRYGKANVWQFEVPDEVAELAENFADGKVKGKSRPGRVKKAGASCKGSVSSLRAKAKKYSGERGKMYHWCANMKSGRNKQ